MKILCGSFTDAHLPLSQFENVASFGTDFGACETRSVNVIIAIVLRVRPQLQAHRQIDWLLDEEKPTRNALNLKINWQQANQGCFGNRTENTWLKYIMKAISSVNICSLLTVGSIWYLMMLLMMCSPLLLCLLHLCCACDALFFCCLKQNIYARSYIPVSGNRSAVCSKIEIAGAKRASEKTKTNLKRFTFVIATQVMGSVYVRRDNVETSR